MRVPKSEEGVESMRKKSTDNIFFQGKGPKRPAQVEGKLAHGHRITQFTATLRRDNAQKE